MEWMAVKTKHRDRHCGMNSRIYHIHTEVRNMNRFQAKHQTTKYWKKIIVS